MDQVGALLESFQHFVKAITFNQWLMASALLGFIVSFLRGTPDAQHSDLHHLGIGLRAANIPVGLSLLVTGLGLSQPEVLVSAQVNSLWVNYWAGGAMLLVGWKALFGTH